MTRPRSLNLVSGDSSRCVPMTTSTEPSAIPRRVSSTPRCVWNRDSGLTVTGNGAYRSENVEKCCWTSSVVGHQDGDLLAVLHRLERGPHRDLGLAVADVAADQPVHRHRPFHVVLDLVDGGELVRGLDVGEGVLQLALPRGVRPEREAGRGHPGRVQLDQLRGDLLDRLAGPALGLGPVRAAQPVQARAPRRRRTWSPLQLVGGHVEPVAGWPRLAGRVLDAPGTRGWPRPTVRDHLHVPAHAVLLVHHVVARSRAAADRPRRGGGWASARMSLVVGSPAGCPARSRLGQHGQLDRGPDEAVLEPRRWSRGTPGSGGSARSGSSRAPMSSPRQHLGQPLGRAVPLGDQHDPPALGQPAAHVGDQRAVFAAVGRCRGGIDAGTEPSARSAIGAPAGSRLVRVGDAEGRDRPPRHAQRRGRGADLARSAGRPRPGRSGPAPPAAAAAQDASRNSWLVRTRSAARVRIRSGSQTSTRPPAGTYVDQQLHPVGQHRRERLHALHRDALGQLAEDVGQLRVVVGQRLGPLRTAAVSSSSRQGGAHRPSLGRARASAGRRP